VAGPEGPSQIPQARNLLLPPEPPWHIEVDKPFSGYPSGDPDLAVRRVQGPVQAELAERLGHAQDEQRLGFVGTEPAQREPVALHQPAAAAWSGFGDDRHARGAEGLQVAVDRPDRHAKLGGERPSGRATPGL
jgi:hypothetical protein